MNDIEIKPDSDIAKMVWNVSVGAFRHVIPILIAEKASRCDKTFDELFDEYEDASNELARAVMEEIYNISDDSIDQLIHYHMMVVTFALNSSGILDWEKGMSEIDELIGDDADE